MKNCCAALCEELRCSTSLFDLKEPGKSSQVHVDKKKNKLPPRQIDIEDTFAPSKPWSILGRTFIAAWVLSCLGLSIQRKVNRLFWLAYLTHWAWASASAYIVASWTTLVYLRCKPLQDKRSLSGVPGLLIKTTWALFALCFPGEMAVTVLYWTLDYDGSAVSYTSAMLHGGGILLLLVDGCLIGRIPLRMKQMFILVTFAALYVVWTASFSFSGLTNPDTQSEDYANDDDAIYPALAWRKDPAKSAILSALITFVLNPLLFLLARFLSRLLPRRLLYLDGHAMFLDEETPA